MLKIMAYKLATETYARNIGGTGTASSNLMCTKARAIALGCGIRNNTYSDNQIVREDDIYKYTPPTPTYPDVANCYITSVEAPNGDKPTIDVNIYYGEYRSDYEYYIQFTHAEFTDSLDRNYNCDLSDNEDYRFQLDGSESLSDLSIKFINNIMGANYFGYLNIQMRIEVIKPNGDVQFCTDEYFSNIWIDVG